MLHDFNVEFGTPTPGVEFLTRPLPRAHRAEEATVVLGGDPPLGLGVLFFRPSLWSQGQEAYLAELYVVPDRRDEGIGGAMMATAMELSRKRGATDMQIGVDEPDVDTRGFYDVSASATTTPTTRSRGCSSTSGALTWTPSELPQPRLPPGAARTGGGDSFWSWRDDIYALAASSTPPAAPPRPGDLRRDALGRHRRRGRVPLPAPPVRTARRTTTRTRWGRRSSPPPATSAWDLPLTPATHAGRRQASNRRFDDGDAERLGLPGFDDLSDAPRQ